MKLYAVTDADLSTQYFTKLFEAQQRFWRLTKKEFPRVADEIALSEVDVPVVRDTVLRLLNGQGGYIRKETILKIFTEDE